MKLMKFKHRVTGADLYVRPTMFAGLMVGGNIQVVNDDNSRQLAVSVLVEGFPQPIAIDDTIESVRKQLTANSLSMDDPTPLPSPAAAS